jgi:hypothetical protein
MAQLFVGIIAEGNTDYRFFKPIIEKTLTNIAYYCRCQIDIDLKAINCEKGNSFNDYVLNASKKGSQEYGISILIVHTDADDLSSSNAYKNKINPAKALIENQPENTHCKKIVALVPIRETESWMLADKDAFIKSIGTKKNINELNISGNPETFTNPKERIEDAIRIGRENMPRKLRNNLKISDLYSYLGQAIQIDSLRTYNSFIDFENNIKNVFEELYLLPVQN